MQVNLLNIPVDHYGVQGIETGNTIVKELKKHGMEAQYDAQERQIVILNSSHIDFFPVQVKLLAAIYPAIYRPWVPVVHRENNEENLKIRLKAIQTFEEGIFSKFI